MITNIKYINKSSNKDLPQVFITAENNISDFNSFSDGIAWRVLKNIGRDSISSFSFNDNYELRAGWHNGENMTKILSAQLGGQYAILQNETGIVLERTNDTVDQGIIELVNHIHVQDGVFAQLFNANKMILRKKIVGYQQSAVFKPSRKLYWGLASEIVESKGLSSESAVLSTKNFFELDLYGLSDVLVSLNGNPKDGYYFKTEYQT
ncbi:hypothetical protein ORJ66_20510 [Pseudoalteromonas tunicata]|uniref:hypothetical protein n=1 Tax=Pseudoalteromonas tunicata TaxID=314281 RepID=UPI00273E690F|nr:hypothetical protein [Pseudoalteromonas tunicata]MDP5215434.1 hypothetical protein [Pseudoalteromonas tunicata]